MAAKIGRCGAAARLIVRDPELAQDAVQEAFVSAWRDLPGLRDPEVDAVPAGWERELH
jgi:DNA-directed RNA polymerase specialized sigma24 family protein